MIRSFHIRFEELQVKPSDLEEIMGYDAGCSPDPFPELYETGLKIAREACSIRGGYRIFEKVSFDREKLAIHLDGITFQPGKIVFTQLKNAEAASLYLCTAGTGITEMARKTEMEGDPMLGYVLDIIGSLTTDKAAETIHLKLTEEVSVTGLKTSDSYSPGYCDWSVAEQQLLFSLLPPDFCGIKLSDSSLMYPIKSVSGIIGIGKNLERKGYQCHWCNDLNCYFGKIKRKKTA